MRVGVVDTDIQSPGIHILFGLNADKMQYSLNDFLWGKCDIYKAAYDVTPGFEKEIPGKAFLIPSSIKAGDIARVLQYGYDVNLLREGINKLVADLELDVLMVDTHPGLNEETLLCIAISDILVVILRPDQQDYQGTGVTLEVSRHLDVPHMYLVVNKVPESLSADALRKKVAETYNCEVAGIIPHSEHMMMLASEKIFVLQYPDNPVTIACEEITKKLIKI